MTSCDHHMILMLHRPTRCLFISTEDLHNHWLDGSLNETMKLSWCVKRCDTGIAVASCGL